jgi:hypothetical protein
MRMARRTDSPALLSFSSGKIFPIVVIDRFEGLSSLGALPDHCLQLDSSLGARVPRVEKTEDRIEVEIFNSFSTRIVFNKVSLEKTRASQRVGVAFSPINFYSFREKNQGQTNREGP